MRKILLSALILSAVGFAAAPASAAPLSGQPIGPQVGVFEKVQMSGYCRRLRRACENKDIRGEVGEGNCRRYRNECLRGYRSRSRD